MKINKLSIGNASLIQKKFNLSSLCSIVLASKGLNDEEINNLLEPGKMANPYDAIGMKEVIKRIVEARDRNEKVIVCGDYDADGICATTILVDALNLFQIKCGYYIPNRFKEGYGLSANTVKQAKQKGYSLIITVDNGVKAFDALKCAKELGIDVIVSDHHDFKEYVDCLHLLHSKLMGEQFQYLSGAGIALEIARALNVANSYHVVLAGIACIGDVMEMKYETRRIVQACIYYLNHKYYPTIANLTKNKVWDTGEIAFSIVPRFNCVGRMADKANTNNMVRYLLNHNDMELQSFAGQIDRLNEERKKLSQGMYNQAKNLINMDYHFQLLFDNSFHEGISGIVAGKLCEEYSMPIMVTSIHEDIYKGSIRSNGSVDLRHFFDDLMDDLTAFGGHEKAAGIAFNKDKKQVIQDYVNERMHDVDTNIEKIYDVIDLPLYSITIEDVESLKQLEPFGEGFKEPDFYFEKVKVEKCMGMSNGLHTKWMINDHIEAIMFQNDAHMKHEPNDLYDFIGNISINSFMGRKKISIIVKEFMKH